MQILILEIGSGSAGWLSHKLARAGFAVQVSDDFEAALTANLPQAADAIIIEAGSEAPASIPVVSRLRSLRIEQPIMVLTSRSSWREAVDSLESGADDFVVKPARSEEIVARLRVAIRRTHGLPTSQVEIGRFTIDLNSQAIWLDGQRLDLTRYEFRLLELMLMKPENVHSADQIRGTLSYHEPAVSPNAIEVRIARLRKKLGPDAIKTIRGVGYRINGDQCRADPSKELAQAD